MAAARVAAGILVPHFEHGVERLEKSGGEPVSVADREADAAIRAHLEEAFPGDALLTEESVDDGERLSAGRVWIVDPLDGTLDFVQGNPEFAVHVALVERGHPVVAAVGEPMRGSVCAAAAGEGACRIHADGTREPLSIAAPELPLRAAVSRLRPSEALDRLVARLDPCNVVHSGSAGLKAALVASGACDVYFAATSKMKEWDLCAPHLLVQEAGGRCTDLFGGELVYNRSDVRALRGLLMTGGPDHERILAALAPVVQSLPWFRVSD